MQRTMSLLNLDLGAADVAPHCIGRPDSLGLSLEASLGSSYLDTDMFASGCGNQSAQNFVLPDELPSPLDACMPAPGLMLSIDDDPKHHHHQQHGGLLAHADVGSLYSEFTGLEGGAGGPLYSTGAGHHLQSAAQQRRLYQLVLLSPGTGELMRRTTDGDAQEAARVLESESGSSALSTAGGSLPRALSFVAGNGSGNAGAAARSDDGEEVGGGTRDQGASAKRQRTGKTSAVSVLVPHGQQQLHSHQEGHQQQSAQQPHHHPQQQQPQRRGPAPKAQQPLVEKRTGPCTHCGVDESPQWRKGPAGKPVLCNACGTRFRRTHQLGPPIPSAVYRGVQPRRAN